MLAVLALSAFVFDYGLMWVGRAQVQTAADAGALAGAISLAYDSATDFASARERAIAAATANRVWGTPPNVTDGDVTFPACPPGAPGVPDTCVRVRAYRNQERGNALDTWLAGLAGVPNQGVKAMATAQILTGSQTECLKPWAVIDRWDEFNAAGGEPDYPNPDPDFQPDSTFDRYSTGQGQSPPQENVLYVPPSASSPGTGFRLPQDYGRQFAIKLDTNTNATVSSGWFRAIRLPRLDGQTGGNVYRNNITSCGGLPSGFATPTTVPCPTNIGNDNAAYWATQGCFATEPGNMIGPTRQGVDDLIARDPGASWGANGIVGSAFSPPTASPRVVPVGLLDINDFLSQDPNGANGVLRMVNIFGFFIEGMGNVAPDGTITLGNGQAVIGRIMTVPATSGGSTLTSSASFLRTIILVR